MDCFIVRVSLSHDYKHDNCALYFVCFYYMLMYVGFMQSSKVSIKVL